MLAARLLIASSEGRGGTSSLVTDDATLPRRLVPQGEPESLTSIRDLRRGRTAPLPRRLATNSRLFCARRVRGLAGPTMPLEPRLVGTARTMVPDVARIGDAGLSMDPGPPAIGMRRRSEGEGADSE